MQKNVLRYMWMLYAYYYREGRFVRSEEFGFSFNTESLYLKPTSDRMNLEQITVQALSEIAARAAHDALQDDCDVVRLLPTDVMSRGPHDLHRPVRDPTSAMAIPSLVTVAVDRNMAATIKPWRVDTIGLGGSDDAVDSSRREKAHEQG